MTWRWRHGDLAIRLQLYVEEYVTPRGCGHNSRLEITRNIRLEFMILCVGARNEII
jgi:hypothetical protein